MELGVALAVMVGLAVCGYPLAAAQRWTCVWAFLGYVWLLLMAVYVVAMLAAPPMATSSPDNDTAAGAGGAILGAPLLVVVAAFVGLGVGAQLLVGAFRPARRAHSEA